MAIYESYQKTKRIPEDLVALPQTDNPGNTRNSSFVCCSAIDPTVIGTHLVPIRGCKQDGKR